MLEIPESHAMAKQVREALAGRNVRRAVAGQNPHRFAWYTGDPALYGSQLAGKTVTGASAFGGMLRIDIGDRELLFADGASPRLWPEGVQAPGKHQLLIEFTDGACMTATVQMYGGIWLTPQGRNDNPYFLGAKEKASPLADAFDEAYFRMLCGEKEQKLSVKAFLATEQRIPGLGNGVLQDILWTAGIHPKRRMDSLDDAGWKALYRAVKDVLAEMTRRGGRDTEKDLYGNAGGYACVLSRRTLDAPCPRCGGMKRRAAYLGGNIYWCESCQKEGKRGEPG
jgi:formamidopyrimidine-DNA glycosylase